MKFITWTIAIVAIIVKENNTSTDVIKQFKVTEGQATTYGSVLGVSKARSLLECIVMCSQQTGCQSVMFEPVVKTCWTNLARVDLTPGVCNMTLCSTSGGTNHLVVKYATRVYRKVTMRMPCYGDSDCVEQKSVCRSGLCLCIPGYSYHDNSKQCLKACGSYGETFQPDEGRALHFDNKDQHTGILDRITCEKLCIRESKFVCRTIDYSLASKTCQLHSITSYERPDLYMPATGHTLYTRDCA